MGCVVPLYAPHSSATIKTVLHSIALTAADIGLRFRPAVLPIVEYVRLGQQQDFDTLVVTLPDQRGDYLRELAMDCAHHARAHRDCMYEVQRSARVATRYSSQTWNRTEAGPSRNRSQKSIPPHASKLMRLSTTEMLSSFAEYWSGWHRRLPKQ